MLLKKKKLNINKLFNLRKINLIILDKNNRNNFKFNSVWAWFWSWFVTPRVTDEQMADYLSQKNINLLSHSQINKYIKEADWNWVYRQLGRIKGISYRKDALRRHELTQDFETIWKQAQKHYPKLSAKHGEEFKAFLHKLYKVLRNEGTTADIDYFKSISRRCTNNLAVESKNNGLTEVESLFESAIFFVNHNENCNYYRNGKFNEFNSNEILKEGIFFDAFCFIVDAHRTMKNKISFDPKTFDKWSDQVATCDSLLAYENGRTVSMETFKSLKWPSVYEESNLLIFDFDFSVIQNIYLKLTGFDYRSELDPHLFNIDFWDKWSFVAKISNISDIFFYWRSEYMFLFFFIVLVFFYSKRPLFRTEYGFSYITAPLFLLTYGGTISLASQIDLFIERQYYMWKEYRGFFFNTELFHVYGFSPGNTFFNELFTVDNFTIFIKIFVLISFLLYMFGLVINLYNYFGRNELLTGLFSLLSNYELNTKGQFYKNLIILLPISIFFLLFLVSSNNFLSLFVCLEGSTLCLYVLSALRVDNRLSVEAGLKYFLTSAVFSCIFGAAVFLLYFITGHMDFFSIKDVIYSILTQSTVWDFYNVDYILIIAILMIIIVFLMKLGSVPYHFWIGDVYQGSPLIITTFFATIVRISFFAIFFKLIGNVFIYMQYSEVFVNILYFSGFFSILIGSFLALAQTEIKRFLAYSSIVHTGFILIGLSTMSFEGLKSSLLYMVVYIFTLLGFLICLIIFQSQIVQKTLDKYIVRVKNINFFSDLQKLTIGNQLILVLFLFSMAGLPPFPGFLIKLYIFKDYILNLFYDIIQYNLQFNLETLYQFFGFFSFSIVVLLSVVTGFNYLRLITGSLFITNTTIEDKPIISVLNLSVVNQLFGNLILGIILFSNIVLIVYIPCFYYSNYLNMIISSLTFSFSDVFSLYPYRLN